MAVDARAHGDQGIDQAEIVERLGPELAPDAVHIREAALNRVGDLRQGRAPQGGLGVIRRPLRSQSDRGERLPDLVMEFARQVAGQTDPNLKAEDVFERAPDAAPDTPAEDVDADDLR